MCLKLIFACWDVFALFWLATMFFTKRTTKRQTTGDRLRYWLLFILAFWLLFGSGFRHRAHHPAIFVFPHPAILDATGLALTGAGLALAIWARVTLGANWSGSVTFKENHELIQRGPYAYVRHPIYTAMLMMFLGTALAIGTWAGLAGVPILFLSFWIKYRQEEALMTEHFGTVYLDYKKRVKALLPFVY